ncbi:hypothetical protein AVDCRST_MAG84-7528 [uncultured Microcoleus sp.]|uniref:Uncharacterized protein n=1 Tax=uncultured Microcoleus sp. TaxID=259945 RepID=A0A6J4PX16_9CYAN|nr:hypothetical protein AVDCRST_MAG84-7528 [uncultured Microcoleus sp.]
MCILEHDLTATLKIVLIYRSTAPFSHQYFWLAGGVCQPELRGSASKMLRMVHNFKLTTKLALF